MDFSWTECSSLLKRTHGVPLVNTRNDCFLNSVLNFVFHTPQLVRYIKFKQRKNECTNCEKCVYCILGNYLMLIENQFEKLEPTEIKEFVDMHFPSRVPGRQEDAHEMLTFLLNQLHSPTLFLASREKPWIKTKEKEIGSNQLIRGKITSNLLCRACKSFRANDPESFHELNLDLHQVNQLNKSSTDENPHLEQYIKSYFSSGALSDFKCKNCKKKEVFRKYFLVEAPALLIIQLKRFSSDGKKDMTNIDIPFDLNLEEYFERPQERKLKGKLPAEYKLYGYISHLGESIQNGHYISTFLGYDGEWYLYDDEAVSPSYPTTTPVSQQYLLFYYRTNIKAPAPRPVHPILAELPRPVSNASYISMNSAKTNSSSRRSSLLSQTSSVSQASGRKPDHTNLENSWCSSTSNRISSNPQKRMLNDQSNSYENNYYNPPSSKRSYDPWEALTENDYHQSDDEEDSRRF